MSQRGEIRGQKCRQVIDIGPPGNRAETVDEAERRPLACNVTFPAELPICDKRAEIEAAIRDHQVVIVCGETGSGKSTQIPKICLNMGRGITKLIGHTQPRRLAARSVAARIAQELESPLGKIVGYKVRFNQQISQSAAIKVMTDGILMAETQHDRKLSRYDTIIIDEAHERSLNIDILIGYLKQLLPQRPDLKIIITSATIDPQRFSNHFDRAPVIEVSGRMFPVEVRYRPVVSDEADEEDPSVLDGILNAVAELTWGKETDGKFVPAVSNPNLETAGRCGDILIFLSGEREIRETAEALRKRFHTHFEILPLYARLSLQEQQRIFEPHNQQRIVLATNVAETSLTVPGIRYVIDPGLARISRYSANARVQRLPIEPISQSSANQRAGRCGRVEAGVCVRLYSQEDFNSRPAYTEPEILRANLASVILQMKALRLGDVERFPFIDAPRPTMVREGEQTLLELGAISQKGELTEIGRKLAQLPVDPRIGRMILAAEEQHCVNEVLVIASALATQDPRLRPITDPQRADIAHAQFADEVSDFLAYLKLWEFFQQNQRALSSNKLRKLCQERFLSYVRLREWQDVHRQLASLVRNAHMQVHEEPASPETIHRALLAGLLGNFGMRNAAEGFEYIGPRERKFSIFPGSSLFKKGPKWVMAAELVQTNRLYARTVARIHPEWIEQVAPPHLVKRTYSEPHWNRRSQHVEAYEKVSVHGMVIVPRRRVHFGAVNPSHAREIFIQRALVEGEYDSSASFIQHNRKLIEELRSIEAKRRRRDVMVDAQARFSFYDVRLPRQVNNGPAFEKWRRKAERRNAQLLFMKRSDLEVAGAAIVDANEYPDALSISATQLPLQYVLAPGEENDGIQLSVPIEMLSMVRQEQTDWLTPGLLREKVAALIKTLPGELRRHFVPVPDFAEAAVRFMDFGKGRLLEQLSEALHRKTGVPIPSDACRPDALPDFLRMRFVVVDAQGREVVAGRDLAQLKRQVAQQSRDLVNTTSPQFHRDHILEWDFGDLPEQVQVTAGEGISAWGYPVLVDRGQSVSLRVMLDPTSAQRVHMLGLRRLFALQVQEELAAHIEYLPDIEEMTLQFLTLPGSSSADPRLSQPAWGSEEFKRILSTLSAERALLSDETPIRTQMEFDRRLRSGWEKLWPAVSEVASLVKRIVAEHYQLDLRLVSIENPFWSQSIDDVRSQLDQLVPAGFLLNTPWQWLQQIPRYLQAVQVRLNRLANAGLDRDRRAMLEVRQHWERFLQTQRERGNDQPSQQLVQYRWTIEELRVSLFAQELGTIMPISSKRLEKMMEEAR